MAVVLAAFSLWAVRSFFPEHDARFAVDQDMDPGEIDIPGEKAIETLTRGIKLVEDPPERRHAETVDFSFLPRPDPVPEKHIPLIVELIFIGKEKNFAAINGQIYEEGEVTHGGKKILSINPDGVLVRSPSTERRLLPWHQTRAVGLQK